ncbi:MAG: hypothetical protein GF332_01680 [Candidatus Moranbacteria bacterium]|nr:hypothetical protein [Candidatus Moranbacteria bacterium]
MSLFTISLFKDEELLAIERQHFLTLAGLIFQLLVLLGVVASIYYFLPAHIARTIILVLILMFSFAYLVYKFIIWYAISLVITDQKIIDVNQHNLSKRVVTEVLISDIANISAFKQGFVQNFFNFGALVIDVKEGGKIVAFNIRDPEMLMANLNKLKKRTNEQKHGK